MKRRKLLVMLLVVALGVTQAGIPAYAATNLDDMPDLEFEESVEDWNDCFLYGHTEVIDSAVNATCTATGLTEGKHCSVCSEVLVPQTETPKLGHQIIVVDGKAPTATEPGWTQHSYCGRCNTVLVAKIDLPATGQQGGSATPEKPDQPNQPSAPSTPEEPVTPNPPAHQHKLVKAEGQAPTCTNTGLTEGLYCSLCDEPFVKQEVMQALGHREVEDAAVAATFDADGKTDGKHCERCGEVTDDQGVIPMIGDVKLSYEKAAYTGAKIAAPTVIVEDRDGIGLVEGTDYTVTGLQARKKMGPYQVTVAFQGRYAGEKALTYAIVPKAAKKVKAELYGADDVKVTWAKATGATGYNVYYKVSGAKKYKFLTATTKLQVKKKNLAGGKKYVFKVVPYYKTGGKKYTSKTANTSSVYTLKKVTGLKVTKSGTKVKVTWKDINGETGYQISKSAKKSKSSLINKGKLTKGKYKKVTAAKGKTYFYKVRACKQVKVGKKTVTIYGPWSDVKALKRK